MVNLLGFAGDFSMILWDFMMEQKVGFGDFMVKIGEFYGDLIEFS